MIFEAGFGVDMAKGFVSGVNMGGSSGGEAGGGVALKEKLGVCESFVGVISSGFTAGDAGCGPERSS